MCFDIFLSRYIRDNLGDFIIYHNHYTLLDVFIISNQYHIYYEIQNQAFLDYSIYTNIYLETNIKNKFKNDEFINYVKKFYSNVYTAYIIFNIYIYFIFCA